MYVTQIQMAEIMETIFESCRVVRVAGQKEYAHDPQNAFGNFERVARDLGLDRKAVLLVYLSKHLDGIRAHCQGHTSQRENVRGRIKDAITYLTLLQGMIEEDEHPDKFNPVIGISLGPSNAASANSALPTDRRHTDHPPEGGVVKFGAQAGGPPA